MANQRKAIGAAANVGHRPQAPGRLLVSQPSPAAMNMAIDQAILETAEQTADQWSQIWAGCLRFYQWQQPTLSLGYFQSLSQRDAHSSSRQAEIVRRASGGGAILHHHELTYSLVMPKTRRLAAGADASLYEKVHLGIANAIGQFGPKPIRYCQLGGASCGDSGSAPAKRPSEHQEPFLCFQRRTAEDLILGGYKIVGSAQRQGRQFVMQHGSVLVAASPLAPELPGINDLGGKTQMDPLRRQIADQLSRVLDVDWQTDELTTDEQEKAAKLTEKRFHSERWLRKR